MHREGQGRYTYWKPRYHPKNHLRILFWQYFQIKQRNISFCGFHAADTSAMFCIWNFSTSLTFVVLVLSFSLLRCRLLTGSLFRTCAVYHMTSFVTSAKMDDSIIFRQIIIWCTRYWWMHKRIFHHFIIFEITPKHLR